MTKIVTLVLSSISSFASDMRGNIAMMFALLLAPLVLTMGAGIDFLRYTTVRGDIQGAIDSGLLSAAELSNTKADRAVDEANILKIIREYLTQNLDSNIVNVDDIQLTVNLNQDSTGREVSVTAVHAVQTTFLKMANINELPLTLNSAAKQAYQSVEISLVLDTSSSMQGAKIPALKVAASEFIDTMITNDTRPLTSINIVPFGGTVNLGDKFLPYADPTTIDTDDDLNFVDGHLWRGCFEFDRNDFDDQDFSQNSNKVIPNFWKWVRTNPWCPNAENEALFLSNDSAALKSKINGLTLSDGTGMDIGATVGLKSLSPAWRNVIGNAEFPTRPSAYNSDTLKVLVVMTDGEITSQHRPEDGCTEANDRKRFAPNAGSAINCEVNQNQRPRSGRNRQTTRQNFLDICDLAKENGVIIYTIGFQIDQTRWSNRGLSQCPQTVSNYFFVEGSDIGAAFQSIAASINGLRITQ